jgi:hypothetical protein
MVIVPANQGYTDGNTRSVRNVEVTIPMGPSQSIRKAFAIPIGSPLGIRNPRKCDIFAGAKSTGR